MVAYNQDGRAEVTTRRWHNNEEAEPWVTPHVTANIPRHAHRSPPSVQTKPSLPPTLPPLLPERSPPRLSGLSPSATRGDFQPRLGAEQLQPYGPPPSVTPLQLQQLASIPFEGWAPTPHLQSGLVQQPFFPYLQAPAASILLLQQLPFVPFEGLAPPEQMFAFLQHSCHSADALHFPERLISCFTSLQLGLMPLCLPSMSDVFMAAPQSNHCYGSTLLENRPDQQSSAGSGRDSLQLPPNTTMMLGSVDGSGPGASSLSRGAIIDHHSSATIRITHQAAAHSQAHRGPAPPGADDAGKRREGANEIADGEHLIDTTVATFAPRERLANFWPQMLAETGTGDSNETRTGGTTYRPRRSRLFSNSSIKSHASILELHGGPSSCQATTLKIYGDKESTRGSSNCDKETKMSSQDFRSINAFAILALGDDSEIEKDSTTTKSAEKLVVDHTGSSSVAGRSQCCSSSERNSRNAMRQESAEAKSCRRAKKRHARGYLMKRPQKRKAKRQASHKEETTRQTKKNDEAGTKEQEQENDLTTRSRQGACPPCWAFCVASFSGLVPYSYGSPLSSTSVHFARMLDRNSSSAVALPSTSAQQKTWSSKMKKPVHQATAKSSCNTMTKSAPNLQCSANRSPPTEGHASSCSLHDVELVTNMGNYRVTKLSGALSQSGALLLHVRTTVFANVLRRIIATLAEFSRQHLLPVWTSVLALSNTAAAVIGALAFRGLAKSASAGSFVLRGSTVVDVSSRWTNQPQARFTAWRKQCESSVLAMGSAGLSRFALLLLLGLLVSCGMAARGGAHVGDQDQWWQAQKQFEDLTKSSTTLPATCNRVRGYGEWHSAWLRFTFPGDPILGSQNWAFSLVPADFTKTKADPLALSALRQAVGDEEGTTTPSDEAGQKPSRESEYSAKDCPF
ncbi:unnamed protein product [Amoebophrya sp. A25]|nr:unnamed protein product [Amoebophrya sp. A25]|eukprot:GSA25T00022041001.1